MRQVTIPRDQYTRLVTLVTWYQAMPDEEVGNGFHENVDDIILSILPTFPEVEDDDYVRDTIEVVEGKTIVTLISAYGDDTDDVQVVVLPEGDQF